MDKENVIYIYVMKYYSTFKEKEILPFATNWMNQQGLMLSEISQIKKDK